MNEEKMDELLRLMRSVVPDTSDMSDAGRVGFVYRHNYDPAVQYEELDVVKFGMSLWTPKVATIGNSPPDQSQEGQENAEENEFWKLFLPGALGSDYVKKTDLASAPTETEPGKPGISYPDGKTITIDENGMVKGAPPGKELSQEEMEQQIESGELADGDVVYLTGPAAGENGLLVKVDSELKDSVNPVQNRVIKAALDRLDALVQETNALRATLETFGLARISESESVTDVNSGLVLSARQNNAAEEGTLANRIEKISRTVDGMEIEFDGSGYSDLNEAVKACIDSLPLSLNKTYFATIRKGQISRAIIQKYISEGFASAIVFGYALDSVLLFLKQSGNWSVKTIS